MTSPEQHRRDKECGLILLIILVLFCSFANWLAEHDRKAAEPVMPPDIYPDYYLELIKK